jgi:hypothetical protein
MLRLYADVLALAARRAARSWLAAVSIPVYAAIFVGAAIVCAPLGIIGTFLLLFVGLACFAGYLYLLADSVSGSKIRARDIRTGMRGLWDVCSVSFAMWIVGLGVSVLAGAAGARAPAVLGVAQVAGAFFFNAVPEVLYLGRTRSFWALKESVDFVMAHAFTWFIPNIVFGLILLGVSGPVWAGNPGLLLTRLAALASPFALANAVSHLPLWAAPLLVAFFHFVMVFRGLLFQELQAGGGNARLRAFRRNMER